MKNKSLIFLKKKLLLYTTSLLILLSSNVPISTQAKTEGQNIRKTSTEEDDDKTVNLIAVGDNLIHGSVYKNGLKNNKYNFDSFFINIEDELKWADIKVINQETILVKDEKNYSGYPTFGSPYEIGEAIVKADFNVVLHATNHTYDKGLKGLKETFAFWEQYKDEVTVLGIHQNEQDYNTIDVIEVNGIKIALLNYTYGLNGFKLPKDKQYLVDTLYNKDKVISDISKAEELGDMTIVFTHWGNEYEYNESRYQSDYAKLMAEAGADLIIGTHPHVLQPLKYIETKDERLVPVYYSLGNFISNQDKKPRMLGGMAKVTIKDINGNITLDCSLDPVITHSENNKPYTAYMLEDYTEELAKKHKRKLTLDYLYKLYDEITKNNVIIKEEPATYKKQYPVGNKIRKNHLKSEMSK